MYTYGIKLACLSKSGYFQLLGYFTGPFSDAHSEDNESSQDGEFK